MADYFEKLASVPVLIEAKTDPNLGMFLVVPCHREPDLTDLLQSLSDCIDPGCSVEVLVLINEAQDSDDDLTAINRSLLQQLQAHGHRLTDWMNLYWSYQDQLPLKKAGVGLARKMAMDEGLRRFEAMNVNGLILNIDADCRCLPNYFLEIRRHFIDRPLTSAAGVFFEHPHLDPAITAYELHLRYYIQAQQRVGLPHAYQTLGSCMVVRSKAYASMGGMNSRKAGEDFYFLHKFIAIGTFSEIEITTVFPSSRPSDRVPFGTGRAVRKIVSGEEQTTTSLDALMQLNSVIDSLPELYEKGVHAWLVTQPTLFQSFVNSIDGVLALSQILQHTSSLEAFQKRFFQWFNAFRTMKFVHYARMTYPDLPVMQGALAFYRLVEGTEFHGSSDQLLQWFRSRARKRIQEANTLLAL